MPEKLVRLVKACYVNSRCNVRVGGDLTDFFEINTALKQGCPLSCMLFNLTLEWVLRNTPSVQDEVSFTNGTVCDRLAYADDADLMGETYRGRDRQLKTFDDTGKRVGLEVSEEKTKVMKMAREARLEDFIDLGGFLIEEVDNFRYLGSIVAADGSMVEEIAARISAASKSSWALNKLIKASCSQKVLKYKSAALLSGWILHTLARLGLSLKNLSADSSCSNTACCGGSSDQCVTRKRTSGGSGITGS